MACEAIILYVEHDDATIRLVEKNLQHNHFPAEFIYFKGGDELLDFLVRYSDTSRESDQNIVIILDLNLPGIHATKVLSVIRHSRDEWIHQLPVIIFTSSANPDDQKKCESLGCTIYLQKSFEDDRLIRALEKICNDNVCTSE